jgi:hypothetical protein
VGVATVVVKFVEKRRRGSFECQRGNTGYAVVSDPKRPVGQMREALDRIERLVVDGLNHGFFEYLITCEIVHGGKRHLVIRAGKSHKYTIPEDELQR